MPEGADEKSAVGEGVFDNGHRGGGGSRWGWGWGARVVEVVDLEFRDGMRSAVTCVAWPLSASDC